MMTALMYFNRELSLLDKLVAHFVNSAPNDVS